MAKRTKVSKRVDDQAAARDAAATIAREAREQAEQRTVRKPADGARMLSAEEVAEQREESDARDGE